MKIRQPAVAGSFYPGNRAAIRRIIDQVLAKENSLIDRSLSSKKIIGAVVPHAGYVYSAYQAVHFFEILKHSEQRFNTFFIINPNHTGYGTNIALDENDMWESPLGKTEVDKEFYRYLNFSESSQAHKFEHSGEVMLPLLQHFISYPFKIVPITMMRQDAQQAKIIATTIHNANKILKKRICIIASSDFSHFVQPDEGRRLDRFVIDAILKLDSDLIFREVRNKNISVCGYGPIMTLIEYAKLESENPRSKILKIGNSGDVHPSDEVVDYVSMLVYE
jgi:AmmeMemoRadiSam system protein B